MQLPVVLRRNPFAGIAGRVSSLTSSGGWLEPDRVESARDRARRLAPNIAAAVLLLAFLITVLPTRAWMTQRNALDGARTRAAELSAENAALQERIEALQTDSAIERLAREQYNLVRPGEEAYAILPAPSPEVSAVTVLELLDAGVFWR